MSLRRRCASASIGLAVAAVTSAARGDSAAPYTVEPPDVAVSGDTVLVCGGACDVVLRQDVQTGQVVAITLPCDDAGGADADPLAPSGGTCASDECVPAGSYRYGYAIPYDCNGTPIPVYASVTVTSPLPAGCMRSAGNMAPSPYGGAVPWASGVPASTQCANRENGCACSMRGAAGHVLAIDLGVTLTAGVALLRRRRRDRRRV